MENGTVTWFFGPHEDDDIEDEGMKRGEAANGLLFSGKELKRTASDTIWANGLRKSFGYDPLLCKCGSCMLLNPGLS